MFAYINQNIIIMKKITTILISSIFTMLMMTSCGGDPTACECLKNLGDVDFTKKCDEYEASLSREESKEWINKLKDCK